ncbi:MAG: YdcF family protein [Candidatus Omnitrophica bacterium]|nr:YdcF family protein [Candidatus Omnitrophota bacterium]
MLKNENIICISSIDWDFVWQGHQEIMAAFARNSNRVLFIENTGVRVPGIKDASRIQKRIMDWFRGVKGIRKEMDNLYVFSPLILPFPYSRIAWRINCLLILPVLKKWAKIMDFADPIIWTFLPTGTALDLINEIDKKLVVYYCIADFEKLVPDPKKIRKTEEMVIRASDLVFVQGQMLKERCKKYNQNVTIFPFGVNTKVFNGNGHPAERPPDIKDLSGIILGYVGGIHRHIDFELVRFLAQRNPGWTLVFIGPVQVEIHGFSDLQNVVFLKAKEHRELAAYVNAFDVCLIPYELNAYTNTVYPTKLNEYLAMGKPVVSTPLPEIAAFDEKYGGVIYVGKDNAEFENMIKKAISEKQPGLKERRIEAARENNWESRIADMSVLMEVSIEKKKLEAESNWKENLVSFYRAARRKAVRLCIICILGYLFLFKTPFVWFLASPLKISDLPRAADAIVVFGGGVGETGSPGKSTIERARYAAELYLKGYAKKIVFSSGYTYNYNDAGNMRLLALSVGVPDKVILLEEKANSTYENALFSKEILKKSNILLVSSPYNMRRASLVFNKWAKDIKVFYTPVIRCQFYDRREGRRLEQIMALAHEYLGIVYYRFKGYI